MNSIPILSLSHDVLYVSDSALRSPCRELDASHDRALVAAVIREMLKALYSDPSSVALAAPQIGMLLQLVVIDYNDRLTNAEQLMVLINPKIIAQSVSTSIEPEICLSIPGHSGGVSRHDSVTVSAYNQHWEQVELTADAFLARVLQHEIDHLHGVLYVDKAEGALKEIPEHPDRRAQASLKRLGMKGGEHK